LLLLLHQGQTLKAAAQTTGLTVRHARKWARRYLALGIPGLADRTGRGRQPVFSPLGGSPSGQDGLRTTG
jgi:transposase